MSQALMFNRTKSISDVSYIGGTGQSITTLGGTSTANFNIDIGTFTYNDTIVMTQHVNAGTTFNAVTDMNFSIGGIPIPSNQKLIQINSSSAIGFGWVKISLSSSQNASFTINGNNAQNGFRDMRIFKISDGFGDLFSSQYGTGTLTLGLPSTEAIGENTAIIAMGGNTSTDPSWTNITQQSSFFSSNYNVYSESASSLITSGSSRNISLSSGDFLVASFR